MPLRLGGETDGDKGGDRAADRQQQNQADRSQMRLERGKKATERQPPGSGDHATKDDRTEPAADADEHRGGDHKGALGNRKPREA